LCAEGSGKLLPVNISGSRESVNLATLIYRNLSDQVGGGAKTINTDTPRVTCFNKRAVSDKSGAK
jgi:hypothetical protein